MALRKANFEGQDSDVAVVEGAAVVEGKVESKTVEVAPASEQAPATTIPLAEVTEATTAVAAAPQKTAVAVGTKYTPALQEFKDQIDPSTLDFDTFPRVTVGLDGFSDDKEKDLGKKIKLKLMSWNERFIITPGVDNDEANKLVEYSLDGKVLDKNGQACTDYLKFLVETEGYKEASIKKYYNIYGFLVESNDAAIDPEDQSIIAVQIPPRSVSQFTRYQIERGVKVAQGVVQPSDTLVMSQIKCKGKSKQYAAIEFSAK